MDEVVATHYTEIVGYKYGEREISLIWVNTSSLGIMVIDGAVKHIIDIGPNPEGMPLSRVPTVITGAMSLVTLCQPPHPVAFGTCFDAAVILAGCDTKQEQLGALSRHFPLELCTLMVEKGWPNALAFVHSIFSDADLAKINEVCMFYFSTPENSTQQ